MNGEVDFVISPNNEYTFTEGAWNNREIFIDDIHHTPYWSIGATVKIGDNESVYYKGLGFHEEFSSLESICNIDNYEGEKLDDGSLQFTYTFK